MEQQIAHSSPQSPSPTETFAPWVDPTFTFAPFADNQPRRRAGLMWVQWSVLLVLGFTLLAVLVGDFANMHEYGWTEDGQNRALLISKNEKIFALGLCAMLPLVLFLISGLEKRLGPVAERLRTWALAPRRPALLLTIMSVFTALAIVAIGRWALEEQPITDDENVYLLQSRIFAAGHLTLPSLPDEEPLRDRIFEDNIFLVNNGKIFGQYPFGQSFILLPGLLVGWARLMPLLLALAGIVGLFLLGRRLYGTAGGLLAALLLTVSPTFLTTSATLLSHPATLCFIIWFSYFAHRTWKEKSWLDAAAAGLFFLLAFQVRSATTLLAAGPIGLALAWTLLRDWRRQWPSIMILTVMIGLTLGVSFFFNDQVNDSIMKTNYHAAWGEGKTPFRHPFGFGKGAWHMVHTPALGFWSTVNNLWRVNWWLLGWPISLLFVLAWLLRRDKQPVEWLAFAGLPLTCFAYFFYFWPGISDTGPVLYYELSAALILLTVSGILAAPRLLLAWMPRREAGRRVTLFVAFSIILAFFSFHQFQIRALNRVAANVGQLDQALREGGVPEQAVIFTNYYLKNTEDMNWQDSWVVGRPPTSRLLEDRRLFYVNYGRDRNRDFLAKHHPDLPAFVATWSEKGVPEVVALEDYTAASAPENFPSSR